MLGDGVKRCGGAVGAVAVTHDRGQHGGASGELQALIADATSGDGHAPFGEHVLLTLQGQRQVKHARIASHIEGRLAGYLVLCESLDGIWYADFVTRPANRSRGVGTALLQAAAATHVGSHDGGTLRTWAFSTGAPDALARRLGMRQCRAVSYQTKALTELPAVTAPPGTVLRHLRTAELIQWLELSNWAFAGHPENGNWSRDDLAWRIAAPWTRLQRFVVLAEEHSDALLGGVWTKVEPGSCEGELYVVAVRPDRAGQGIGRVVVAQSLRVLARAGMTTASLYVDTTNTTALALYQAAGFTSQHTDRCFELNIAR